MHLKYSTKFQKWPMVYTQYALCLTISPYGTTKCPGQSCCDTQNTVVGYFSWQISPRTVSYLWYFFQTLWWANRHLPTSVSCYNHFLDFTPVSADLSGSGKDLFDFLIRSKLALILFSKEPFFLWKWKIETAGGSALDQKPSLIWSLGRVWVIAP